MYSVFILLHVFENSKKETSKVLFLLNKVTGLHDTIAFK